MSGGIGGTGAPYVSSLYEARKQAEPVGNVFEYILREAASKRDQKPAQRVTEYPKGKSLVGPATAEMIFKPLASRESYWSRF